MYMGPDSRLGGFEVIQIIKHHRRTLVSIVSLCVITLLILNVYSLLQKEITVKVDDHVTAFKVTTNTVEELLYQKDIQIGNEDYISHELDQTLKNGMEIIIKKAVPITIYTEESKLTLNTSAKTVREVIEYIDIEVDENDIVTPALSANIKHELEINIIKVDEEIEEVEEEIPFKVVEKNNDDLFKGKIIKTQNGKNGIRKINIKRRYENGQLVSEITENSIIVREPIDEIVERGTKELLASSNGMITYDESVEMVATAYDLSFESTGKNLGDNYFGITASGTKARPGVVAVDPKVIPLGTKLYIESLDSWPDYGFAVAEDTGGAIKGNKIDLFMENHSRASRFGRRGVKVYILDWWNELIAHFFFDILNICKNIKQMII